MQMDAIALQRKTRKSKLDKRLITKKPKNKYKSKKTEVDGILFDSKMESEYYQYLLEDGRVESFIRQPIYLLLPSFTKKGKKVRKTEYKADFLITYTDGTQVVVDVKGVATRDFLIKAKLFDYYYPDLDLQIVTKHKGKWILLKDKPKKN